MNTLLKLSGISSGRFLLHMICLSRCLALKRPDRRARATFHWLGAKRELLWERSRINTQPLGIRMPRFPAGTGKFQKIMLSGEMGRDRSGWVNAGRVEEGVCLQREGMGHG